MSSTRDIQSSLLAPAQASINPSNSAKYTIAQRDLSFENGDIGSGNYGTVYLGRYRSQVVAIKKLNRDRLDKLDQFREENRMLAYIQDKALNYVAKYYGYTEFTEGSTGLTQAWIVMEYFANGDLLDYQINPDMTNAPWPIYYKFSLSLTAACIELHENGIVHADLKPGNCMRTAYDDIKLIDFGFALQLGDEPYKILNHTSGTPGYVAPEILTKSKYSKESDIFALGSILYLFGERHEVYASYPSMDMRDVLIETMTGKRDEITASTPPGLARLITWCWEHEPAKRPSAKKLHVELELLDESFNPKPCV